MLLYEIAAWEKVAGYLIVQVDFKPNLFGFKAIPACHIPLTGRMGDICKGEMSFSVSSLKSYGFSREQHCHMMCYNVCSDTSNSDIGLEFQVS